MTNASTRKLSITLITFESILTLWFIHMDFIKHHGLTTIFKTQHRLLKISKKSSPTAAPEIQTTILTSSISKKKPYLTWCFFSLSFILQQKRFLTLVNMQTKQKSE